MKTPPWIGLVVVLSLVGWGWVSLQPPSVITAGPGSGSRAMEVLERLVEDMGPHPVGTPPSREVERRLRRELTALGFEVEVVEQTRCGYECLTVRNLLVVVPGSDPDRWVGLSTHYDSVWAGPGVGDDLAGVAAAVEILRTVADEPGPAGIVALFNEGEEANLYGAKLFAEGPWVDRLDAVVNLEARGTSGPAYLFEINGAMATIGRAYADHARSPSVSGLYVAIYRMLPNNTDVAVFTAAGVPAANIAFLGHGERYHTPMDDLPHLDPRTLQHQVDQGLAMVRGFRSSDATWSGEAGALLFDLGGWFVVSIPFPWAHGLLLLVLPVVWSARPTWRASVVVVSGLVGGSLAAAGLDAATHALGGSFATVESFTLLAYWSLALGAVIAIARRVPDDDALLGVIGWVFVAAAVVVSFVLPEGSYLFTLGLPALGVGLSWRRARFVAAGAGWMMAVLAMGLPDALGVYGGVVVVPAMLTVLPAAPWLRSGRLLAGSMVLVVVHTGVAVLAPEGSPERPVALVQDVVTDGTDGWSFTRAAGFPRGGELPYPPMAPTVPPPIRFAGRLDAHPATAFRPSTITLDQVVAPGGWAARLQARGGHFTSIQGHPTDKRALTWLGDTSSLSYTTTPGTSEVVVCIARPHVLPATTVPVHPIHTGARAWSCQTTGE